MSFPPSLWFSFSSQKKYIGDEPAFFDAKDLPWASKIEANWQIIKEEMENVLSKEEMNPYFNEDLVSNKAGWKVFDFKGWNIEFPANMKKCPKTIALLQEIPGWVSGSFTMLEPHTRINGHNGDTNAIVRCHLGLTVPGKLPECGFQVAGEDRSWEEGKLLIFCDAHYHQGWNHTDGRRYILLFDVMRPEFIEREKRICNYVVSTLIWQMIEGKVRIARKLPLSIRKGILKVIQLIAGIIVPIRNNIL